MTGVRRVTRSILRYVFPLYVIAIVLQVYLAGEGIFGNRDNEVVIAEHDSLELHRGFGWIIAQPIALIVLILALLAWFPGRRIRLLSIVAPILLFVQSLLPSAGRYVAGLHVPERIPDPRDLRVPDVVALERTRGRGGATGCHGRVGGSRPRRGEGAPPSEPAAWLQAASSPGSSSPGMRAACRRASERSRSVLLSTAEVRR